MWFLMQLVELTHRKTKNVNGKCTLELIIPWSFNPDNTVVFFLADFFRLSPLLETAGIKDGGDCQ